MDTLAFEFHFSAVTLLGVPELMISFSTNTTSITACASMDFPNAEALGYLMFDTWLLYHASSLFAIWSSSALRESATRPFSSIPVTLTAMTSPTFTTSSTF